MSKASDTTKTSEPKVADKMQQQLSERILPMFDSVRRDRETHFQTNPVPDRSAVPAVISAYAYKCASISAGCNLVPGPWGLIAIVPEIGLILSQQLKMVYDIGRAYGHTKITQELLLGIVLSGTGTGTGGLVVIHGGKVIVKRASLRLIQKLVAALGGRVTQRVLRSMLAKWVPILGAAAMAAWAKYSTDKLGQQAREIFGKEIVLEDELLDDDTPSAPGADGGSQSSDLLTEKVRLMVALTWIDRRADDKERDYVVNLLEDPDLPASARAELQASLDSGKVTPVNYAAFEGREDEKIATVMDMIVLMKADGTAHPAEKMFIKKVAQEFGLPDSDVQDMIAT